MQYDNFARGYQVLITCFNKKLNQMKRIDIMLFEMKYFTSYRSTKPQRILFAQAENKEQFFSF